MYMPTLGRWISKDPLPEKGESEVLYTHEYVANRMQAILAPYTYAASNPIIFVDPNGLEAWERDSDIALLGKQYFGPWPAQRNGKPISECADFQIPIVTTTTFKVKLIGRNDDAELAIPVVGSPKLGNPESAILSSKDNRSRLDKIPCFKSVWVSQLCKRKNGCEIVTKTFYVALPIPGKLRVNVGVVFCDTKNPKTKFDAINKIGDILKQLNDTKTSICNLEQTKEEKPDELIAVRQGPESATKSCNNPVLR